MATIRKKPTGGWVAQVRHRAKNGLPAISKAAVFPRKADAEAWAAKTEADWQTMRFGGSPNILFAEVLERYKKEVSPKKRGWKNEINIIERVLKTPLAQVRLPNLSELHFQEWANGRMADIAQSSVRREWNVLSHVCSVASKQWRLLPENFMLRLDKPNHGKERTQRVTDDMATAIAYVAGFSLDCLPVKSTQRVAAAFYFGLETAMRGGEMVTLTWDNVFLDRRFVHLPDSKNGYARDVPLSLKAVAILKLLAQVRENERVFNITKGSLDALFRKLRERSDLGDVHFHDSRREALTRLALIFLPMELAKISGHRDLRILLNTYYAPRAEDLAAKMDG
ncbi:site-specific integrase [Kingella kingae]|uniref:site-specific integrase n=1 Tax=Kingella kingae TaxID=504 RepID=UPI0003F62841|nr:site-specific integrase [Kingella kingae]